MEGKSRQNRIVNNRIPFERFVRLFAMIEIVLAFLYAKCFATFSVYGIRIWVLVIIVSILAVGSLVLSWKAERNWVSLIRSMSSSMSWIREKVRFELCFDDRIFEYLPPTE